MKNLTLKKIDCFLHRVLCLRLSFSLALAPLLAFCIGSSAFAAEPMENENPSDALSEMASIKEELSDSLNSLQAILEGLQEKTSEIEEALSESRNVYAKELLRGAYVKIRRAKEMYNNASGLHRDAKEVFFQLRSDNNEEILQKASVLKEEIEKINDQIEMTNGEIGKLRQVFDDYERELRADRDEMLNAIFFAELIRFFFVAADTALHFSLMVPHHHR